jgi:hypothetical protein
VSVRRRIVQPSRVSHFFCLPHFKHTKKKQRKQITREREMKFKKKKEKKNFLKWFLNSRIRIRLLEQFPTKKKNMM